MTWPRDDAKLERVRRLMAEAEIDALVVRAPDNVLYLSNFWGMKGYDVVVFPRDGEPTLICLEASEADAARTAWTQDVRPFDGYDERDPRPPIARALDRAARRGASVRADRTRALLGTQAADKMVGEPTTYTAGWFGAFDGAVDATPLLSSARAVKTEQELERIQLANDIAAAAMEHCRSKLEPGMKESEAGAMWNGFVHGNGTGWADGKVELAHGFSLVWSGPGIRTFTPTGARPVQEHEPTLFEIWVCADGYWCDHTKNLCPGELDTRLRASAVRPDDGLRRRDRPLPAGREPRRARPSHPRRAGGGRLSGPALAPGRPRRRRPGARAALRAPGRRRYVEEGMVLAIEPGVYWPRRRRAAVEDNFVITEAGARKLSSFPDGVVTA